MSEFTEADARLSAMHGYEALRAAMSAGEPTAVLAVLVDGEQVGALQRIAAVEAKLDALIVALRAGAIGKWTP